MGYVYLLGSSKYGWYKIGKSTRPEIRVRELGILLPFTIEPIGVWRVEDHSFIESMLHELFVEQRINGEWFELECNHLKDLFARLHSYTRVFPIESINLDVYVARFLSKPLRKAQSKILNKLIVERMGEILADRGLASTPENRKLVRSQVVQELRIARKK